MNPSKFRFNRLILAIILGHFLGPRTVLAMDSALPTPTPIPGLDRSLPTECTIEPLPNSFFEAYVRDSSGAVTSPAIAGLPIGTPEKPLPAVMTPTVGPSTEDFFQASVDSATDDAVNSTFHDYIACFNASDLRRMFALFTTSFLNEFLQSDGEPIGEGDLEWIAAMPIP